MILQVQTNAGQTGSNEVKTDVQPRLLGKDPVSDGSGGKADKTRLESFCKKREEKEKTSS